MARKNKEPLVVSMIHFISLVPWWVGIAFAAISYLYLHSVANQIPLTIDPSVKLDEVLFSSIYIVLATAGQYILPFVGLLGSLLSLYRGKQRTKLIEDVGHAPSANALNNMSWREFELLVGEAFRLKGYRVTENSGGPDGGIDLAMSKDNEVFFVQCKQWKAVRVGVSVVRELYGVMAAKGASGGFVVTSGRFTDEANKFVDGRNIVLVDGPSLFSMIKLARHSLEATTNEEVSVSKTAPFQTAIEPTCTKCGAFMVKRTARNGSNAGGEFWGCSNYPSCRGVKQLPGNTKHP